MFGVANLGRLKSCFRLPEAQHEELEPELTDALMAPVVPSRGQFPSPLAEPRAIPRSFAELDAKALADLRRVGYVALRNLPGAREATHSLLQAARSFFAQPIVVKEGYRDPVSREIGYKTTSHSERYFIRQASMPLLMRREATAFWEWASALAGRLLTDIAHDLGLPPQELLAIADLPNTPPARQSQSILRLIRGLPTQHTQKVVVTPQHTDLGMLAIGVRFNAGLQTCHPDSPTTWRDVEHALQPHDVVVLVGDSLHNLTNRTYTSCMHRVTGGSEERYSLVFHVRLKQRVMLESAHLSNQLAPFGGEFAERSDRYVRRLHRADAPHPAKPPKRALIPIPE